MDEKCSQFIMKHEKFKIEEVYIKEEKTDLFETSQNEERHQNKFFCSDRKKLNLNENEREHELAIEGIDSYERICKENSEVEPEIEENFDPCDMNREEIVKSEEFIVEKEKYSCCVNCNEKFDHENSFDGEKKKSCRVLNRERKSSKTKSSEKNLSLYKAENVQFLNNENCDKEKTFNYEIPALQIYLRTHIGDKPFKCDICSYATTHKSQLKTHLRIHSGEKPFKCNRCPYSACQKGQLKNHLKTHSGKTVEKPFKCDKCSYAGSHKSQLDRHLRIHSGEKPFKCNNCSYAAACKSNLLEHLIRIHSGEKPFACSNCSYAAACKNDLQRHLKTHSELKPFKCNNCSYASSRRSHYMQHLTVHSAERPFKCTKCSYAASCKKYLTKHLRIHKRI